MKKTILSLGMLPVLFSLACTGGNHENKTSAKQIMSPGKIVDSASMPVTDDSLNHFRFTVSVVADSAVSRGVYDVDAAFGPNTAHGQFTMPKGGEDLAPLIRVGNTPYTYIIGFKVAGDTTFYDYFEVSSSRTSASMRYLKSYTF